MSINYKERLNRVQQAMRASGVELLVLTPGAAMRHLSGFSEPAHERFLALIVQLDAAPLFITPALNAAQAEANPAGITDIRVWDDSTPWLSLAQDFHYEMEREAGIVAVDDNMPARFTLNLQELLPASSFVTASKIIHELRLVKEAAEMECLHSAARITDLAIRAAYDACKPGRTELDVSFEILRTFAAAGAAPSFDAIVAAGANGAMPHHHTGQTILAKGDVVVLDFGARCDGYCGDITRTVAVNYAPDLASHVYAIVYEAHQRGLEAIRPGATAHDVDAAVRQVIVDAGYGEYFLHRTGHGIGLDEHEPPYIVAGNMQELRPGHCFSIEPGIYLPGQFGVRLENIVTIADDGSPLVLNSPISADIPVLS